MFRRISPFFQDVNDKKDGRNHLFILGDAGMGKSSLLLMLKIESMKSFSKTKFKFELNKIGPNTLSEIDSIENKVDTILLLDALDEDVNSWGNVRSRIREIVKATLEFKKVIITCRTQFFPVEDRNLLHSSGVINLFDYRITALFISLFKEKEIDEYLKKKFNKNKSKINIAKRAVGRMKELRARSLVLSHIDDLLATNTPYNDVYTVYEAMLSAWLNREYRKHQHITAEQLRLGCFSLATHMSVRHERSVSPDEIDHLIVSETIISSHHDSKTFTN